GSVASMRRLVLCPFHFLTIGVVFCRWGEVLTGDDVRLLPFPFAPGMLLDAVGSVCLPLAPVRYRSAQQCFPLRSSLLDLLLPLLPSLINISLYSGSPDSPAASLAGRALGSPPSLAKLGRLFDAHKQTAL